MKLLPLLASQRAFRFLLSGWILLSLLSCTGGNGSNGQYPNKPITYLVPWSPGGGTDLSSRTLAQSLQQVLGEPVNVVNRTGGGGVVGHLALSQAQPNGYTLGAITVEIAMMHWQGLTPMTYEDFTPLALIMDNAATITVRADAPWSTLDELVADIRANPGKFQASGTSKGGIWDLARVGFLQAIGVPESAVPWVPSQGAAPALQELLAEGVDIVTASIAEVDALRQAGQVKVLGVMADQRLANFPEVPTLKEQGVEWSLVGWVGVGAPAGLPDPILARLDSSLQVATQSPDYLEAMNNAGFNIRYMDAAAFSAFLEDQNTLFGDLLKVAGISKAE